MTKPLFSKSTRKYIRFQKARIRREIFDIKKQRELIQKLIERFNIKPEKSKEKPKEKKEKKPKIGIVKPKKQEEKPKKVIIKKKAKATTAKEKK